MKGEPADILAIQRGEIYTLATACKVLCLSRKTVLRRIKAGEIRLTRDGRVLGSELIDFGGEALAEELACPPKHETKAQRKVRNDRALAELPGLV